MQVTPNGQLQPGGGSRPPSQSPATCLDLDLWGWGNAVTNCFMEKDRGITGRTPLQCRVLSGNSRLIPGKSAVQHRVDATPTPLHPQMPQSKSTLPRRYLHIYRRTTRSRRYSLSPGLRKKWTWDGIRCRLGRVNHGWHYPVGRAVDREAVHDVGPGDLKASLSPGFDRMISLSSSPFWLPQFHSVTAVKMSSIDIKAILSTLTLEEKVGSLAPCLYAYVVLR